MPPELPPSYVLKTKVNGRRFVHVIIDHFNGAMGINIIVDRRKGVLNVSGWFDRHAGIPEAEVSLETLGLAPCPSRSVARRIAAQTEARAPNEADVVLQELKDVIERRRPEGGKKALLNATIPGNACIVDVSQKER